MTGILRPTSACVNRDGPVVRVTSDPPPSNATNKPVSVPTLPVVRPRSGCASTEIGYEEAVATRSHCIAAGGPSPAAAPAGRRV
jgi:hypothetical protein